MSPRIEKLVEVCAVELSVDGEVIATEHLHDEWVDVDARPPHGVVRVAKPSHYEHQTARMARWPALPHTPASSPHSLEGALQLPSTTEQDAMKPTAEQPAGPPTPEPGPDPLGPTGVAHAGNSLRYPSDGTQGLEVGEGPGGRSQLLFDGNESAETAGRLVNDILDLPLMSRDEITAYVKERFDREFPAAPPAYRTDVLRRVLGDLMGAVT